MSIRFAAARKGETAMVSRVLRRPPHRTPANDTDHGHGYDHLLRSALAHFVEHGLAAVSEARNAAEQARGLGDDEQFQHWLGICGKFDRRMARRLRDGAKRR